MIDRRTFIAAAPTAALVPAGLAAETEDPAVDLVARWRANNAAWRDALNSLDPTEDEPNGLTALADETEALAERISATKPTTQAGARAILEWLDEDSVGLDVVCSYSVTALRNVIEALAA